MSTIILCARKIPQLSIAPHFFFGAMGRGGEDTNFICTQY
jgi:hypothetical protein